MRNHHATALVIGCQGFLFVGPSGAGKTRLALACLAEAQARNIHAAIIADDQVFLSEAGSTIIAEAPQTIAGLAEVRGSGIVQVPSQSTAVMDFAVLPVSLGSTERLPPEDEMHRIAENRSLPLIRLPADAAHPLDLLLRLADARRGN